ncbi:MAG TPA: hypothetical protein VF160_13770 [Candidatus Dormibacteraeota bacterium]
MALATVIALAVLLAGWWAFAVPILQSPDEDSHFDYAMSEYSAGHLLRATERPVDLDQHIRRTNPFVAYLEDRTGFDVVRHWYPVKSPPGYGDAAYFAELDANAPLGAPQTSNPALIRGYPYGYYAATALWMAGVHLLDPSPLALFFGARLFSVFLLALSLLFTYQALRELPYTRFRALALVAVTGLFPMTTFISSYVQPENLAWTAAAAALLAAVKLRRRRGSWRWLLGLGFALGVLGVTKAQYVPYIAIASLGAVALPYIGRLRSLLPDLPKFAVAALPALALEAVDLWVTAGRQVGFRTQHAKDVTTLATLVDSLHHGPLATASFLAHSSATAYYELFVAGIAASSFWGEFGWLDTPLVIGSVWLRLLIVLLTVIVLVLVVMRMFRLGQVVWAALRRRRLTRAWALVFGNPVLLAYLLWTVAAFGITVLSDNTVNLQGREWLVVLPGFFIAVVHLAPRAIPHRRVGRVASQALLEGLLLYAVAGSVAAPFTIYDRYYGHGRQYAAASANGLQMLEGGSGAVTSNVPSGRDFTVTPPAPGQATVPDGGYMAVAGWALPPPGHGGARGVVLSVDGSHDFPAVYGDDGPGGRRDGFDGIVYLDGLAPGTHAVTVKLLDADGRSYYAVGDSVPFTVLPAGTNAAAGATR